MKTKNRFLVKVEKLPARTLFTIGPEHLLWSVAKAGNAPNLRAEGADVWKGTIVRLQPPSTATDDHITNVKRWLEEMGAAIVRTDSRATADLLPLLPLEERASLDQRTVVMRLAEGIGQRVTELKELLDVELSRVAL